MTKKVMLVTGASKGIGAETALAAAEAGFSVCINYLNHEDAALKLLRKIRDKNVQAIAVKANIAEARDVRNLFHTIDRELGTLTALVNNAGILETKMTFNEMSEDRFRRIFDVNVIGTFLCTKEAIDRMSIKRGGDGGAIVNVSSVASRTGSPHEYIDYAASKGAIDSFTLGLAKEVGEEGIRVNAVRPGFIHTDIHASGGEPDRVERLKESIPMKRGGTPREVAKAILWLLSDEASYVSGSFLEVAGGR